MSGSPACTPLWTTATGTKLSVALLLPNRPYAFAPPFDNDPRQDDYDIWLGTNIIQPWIAYERHGGSANYLYLDGHVSSLTWTVAVPDLFPDKVVLTQDESYP